MKKNFKKFFSVIISFIIILTVFIPNVFAVENEISEVNLVIPFPKVGEEISSYDDVVIDNDKCYVTSIIWISEKGGLETIAQSDVFLPGYNYSVIITLNDVGDKAGFAEDCVVTLNGETVDVYDSESNGFIIFEHGFGEAESNDEDFSFSVFIGSIKEFFKKMYKVFAAFFGLIVY